MLNSTANVDEFAQPSLRTAERDTRPGLMICSNVITPYRVNLHQLIVAGVPELKLHTMTTHGVADFDWQMNLPAEINPVNFSVAGESALEHPLRRPGSEIRKGARLIQYIKDHDVRAVVFNGYRYISYLRLMDYCYRNGIPAFLRSDSNIRSERPLSLLERAGKRRLYHWMMKRSKGVCSMGELGDQFFLKYGADPHRIYRVPYWPDYDLFATVDKVALDRFRRKYGLDDRRRYVMYSGRLISSKRVDLLIDAFVGLAAERPDWDLLVCGDGLLRDELQRRVPEGLRKRIIWTGFLDCDDLVVAYHSADVLAVPSAKEPWALVVQEAMAAGMVVVASDVVGAAHEMIDDGESGRIFASGNTAALREALKDVTQSDRLAMYRQRSAAALCRYREEVDPVAEIRRALTDVGVLSGQVAG